MTFIITGGGTGGHIYPALSVARELKRRHSDTRIILVGASRGLEKKIYSESEFKSYFLPVGQLHQSVGFITRFLTLLFLPFAFLKAFFIFVRYRPKAVLGVGGYASGPMAIVSATFKCPTFIWEANSLAGMANKYLARFKKVTPLLVFDETAKNFPQKKCEIVGLPVRYEMEYSNLFSKPPSTGNNFFTVLFVGGSQGARVFNEVVPELEKIREFREINVIHQTGGKNFKEVSERYSPQSPFQVLPYLDPIKDYYEMADLIVCRAGASTLVELSILGKPCIIVPFPKASDDHQRKNAEALLTQGAADMILEKDLTPELLKSKILYLMQEPAKLAEMSKNFKGAFPRGARERIAELMEGA